MAWPCDTAVNAAGSCAGTQLDRVFLKLIKNPITRVLNCSKNVEKLNNNLTTLVEKRQSIQHDVDDAERRAEEIELEVTNWMAKADKHLTEEAKRLRDRLEAKAMKRCFMGLRLNPVARYKLSKKAEEDAIAVDRLVQQRSQFGRISYFPYDRSAANRGNSGGPADCGFQDFESRSRVLEEIMDSLKQPSIKRIGLHGMPGVGKTTLAKEVKRRSQKEKLFDAVVLAAVTKTPDLKRIQAEIARDLDLVLPNRNEEREPDVSIKKMLEDKKNVLVILDDVWAKLDLNEIGIPLEHTGLKILLTSRNRGVLSRELCSDKNIKVGQLQDKEAWKLFVEVVGADGERFDLKPIAIQVVEKCGGLPLAIVTLGTALKGRESDDWWHDALEQLKNPAPESFEGVSGEVYAAIEFSYNHLRGDGLKKTFLLCSFLCQLEDNIELLVRYAVGLHLFPNINAIEATRHRVRTHLSRLKDAALLVDVNSNCKFGIHDVVRDVAMAIAARDNCGLLLEDEQKLDTEALTKFNWIFLSENANIIDDLPNDIEFPSVILFHLQPYGPPRKDLTSLFKGMQKLKVLNVPTTWMPNECLSPSFLTNLCSLTIWEVDDVTVLGELKNLEVLCIHGRIEELPSKLGKLTRLKVLDLRGCVYLKVISQNVIAKLSRLEELYFHRGWNVEGIQWELAEDGEQRNASLAELAHLHTLKVLHLGIQDVRSLPTNFIEVSSRLESFFIQVSSRLESFCVNICSRDPRVFSDYSRTLWLQMDEASCLDRSIRKLLKKTEALLLDTMKGLKNVVYELDVEGFQELKVLHIVCALEMQYIVNSVDRVGSNAFPILETLNLCGLSNLERMSHDRLGATSFSKLKEVYVSCCDQIKILFSLSMVRQLLQLQEIHVFYCKKMVGIVDEERQGDTNNKVVEATDQKVELGQFRSLRLTEVPEFISFCYGKKSSLTDEDKQNPLTNDPSSRPIPLFNNEVVFPNLEELKLRSIKIKMIWHISAMAHCIMNLTKLTIEGCHNLELLLSSSMENSISFPQLNCLKLKNLQNLVKFCSGNCMIEFPSLKQLAIQKCPKLKGPIVKSTSMDAMADRQPLFNKQVVFPNLEKLTIDGCHNLVWLFSSSIAVSLVNLRDLKIKNCGNIREIMVTENAADMEDLVSFSQLKILVIEKLPNLVGFSLGNYIMEFPSMKQLQIEGCPKFEMFTMNSRSPLAVADIHHFFNEQVKFPVLERLGLVSIGAEFLFSSSAVKSFEQLRVLSIYDCKMMKGVIVADESTCELLTVLFPNLVRLVLMWLPKLTTFYMEFTSSCSSREQISESQAVPATQSTLVETAASKLVSPRSCSQTHVKGFPSLRGIAVAGCHKVRTFASEIPVFERTQGDNQLESKIPHPMFWVNQATFPSLEELQLRGNYNMTEIWCGQYAASFFLRLKVLELENTTLLSGVFPYFFYQLPNPVEQPHLGCSSFSEVFQCEGVHCKEKPADASTQLSDLRLSRLQHLIVLKFSKIKSLLPSFISFENLQTLLVNYCHGLENLMTYSLAKSLVRLRNMSIEYCNMVEEIIVCLDDEVKDAIVFSQLEGLNLRGLPRVSSFCSVECNFKFPSLEDISVGCCPEMQIFSKGELDTPKLRKVRISERDPGEGVCIHDWRWNGNLNTTIRQFFAEKNPPKAGENMMSESNSWG